MRSASEGFSPAHVPKLKLYASPSGEKTNTGKFALDTDLLYSRQTYTGIVRLPKSKMNISHGANLKVAGADDLGVKPMPAIAAGILDGGTPAWAWKP